MQNPTYLSISGTTQGFISEGASTEQSVIGGWQKDHEDKILVWDVSHNIYIPHDPSSGRAGGQSTHKPLVITKAFDKSSPLLFSALTRAEKMSEWHLELYRDDAENGGALELFYTITLEGAVIVDIQSRMPLRLDSNNEPLTHREEVSFSYRKITWEHIASNTSGSYDWSDKKTG
ncbi:Hcp family type VI secretion system effector [Pseudomonas sp. H3(2019)]|uniref:Hcp family type VI secretion system effector n=1 Tax=Pseudomonas sp. H3(2019) TaxID=2598724 RepID=UPI0011974B52|nr:Hcp family type VI secretion system effector [Pseudomonas sp. H3(2019)]TVT81530.1 Hcp family type VI secretion system effector [Pseudomonas sp. H3(2019)]